ncbi:MAG: preprotein translocase subunit SecY [Clostridia bacterium]|nr:preprotein translocase subunit SecY [Clostridia bacterium]
MFKNLINAFKTKEVRVKLLLTLLLLLIYRVGCFLPIPGLQASSLVDVTTNNSFLGLLNSISGGSLSNGAFLALGVSPYISSSIIIQLLSIAIPSWQRLSKEGEEGRKKMAKYTRVCALILSIAQAVGIVIGFSDIIDTNALWAGCPAWVISMFVAITLIAGGMFTVWLGERISDIGVGNGLSLLIFVGILASAGTALINSFAGLSTNINNLWSIIIFLVALVLIFALIVFVDGAERKVPVQYAKQIKGRKMYGGQSTNIPIRVNATGVMPIIFASALLTFPQLIMSIFWPNSSAMAWYNTYMGAGSWVNIVLTALLILFFSYFYSQITFNPEDISKQMQQNGGYIPGIRPGKPTAEHLKKISNRVILFGAIFLAFIALIPNLVFKGIGNTALVNGFSATGLLIVVSVALEFDKQLEAQLLMRNYRGFLK